MNNLYQDIYYEVTLKYLKEDNPDQWTWEKYYCEAIVQKCLEQVSDFLDKQRIIKLFGIEEN